MPADQALAVAIAFVAAGAVTVSIVVQLVLLPRNRGLRWFVAFQLAIVAWLGLQGWIYLYQEIGALGAWYEGTVHMLPGLFLASTLVEERGWSDLRAFGVVALAAALLPISIGSLLGPGPHAPIMMYQLAGWSLGAWTHARGERRVDPGTRRRLRRTVVTLLLVIGPLAVLIGWLVGGDFFTYVMPLLMIGIEILIFVGIVHLRFYDIEVRAARSGETASRAAELERMAVVGELAASFAHEVRNPLTGVRSLAQRLAQEEVSEERRRKYADVIVREVGRVETIVSRLLGAARHPGREEEADGGTAPLEPLFEDVALLVGPRARDRGVTIEADAGRLAVIASRAPLAQVLLNLVINAVDHAPAQTTVELVARSRDGRIAIEVRDRGPGIPPEERERVLEPLYSRSGGTGLGLAIVRRIVDEHGWSLVIGDAEGGGAAIELELPAPPWKVPT